MAEAHKTTSYWGWLNQGPLFRTNKKRNQFDYVNLRPVAEENSNTASSQVGLLLQVLIKSIVLYYINKLCGPCTCKDRQDQDRSKAVLLVFCRGGRYI